MWDCWLAGGEQTRRGGFRGCKQRAEDPAAAQSPVGLEVQLLSPVPWKSSNVRSIAQLQSQGISEQAMGADGGMR